MSVVNWTTGQLRAIETLGKSLAVTAAAGSGKTAVLTERCARIVCDAPTDLRCPIDRILVVTFTEAAAAEMKERIRAQLRGRLRTHPDDAYLREQIVRLETSHISTLHSFCLWMVRRWFHIADIDPASVVLPADEARLLKADTLDRLFDERYAGAADDQRAAGFRALIDVYGLGQDTTIRSFVLRLADYVVSLPDPTGWLRDCCDRYRFDNASLRRFVLDPLVRELQDHARAADDLKHWSSSTIRPIADHGSRFAAHAECLRAWIERLRDANAAEFDRVRTEVSEHTIVPVRTRAKDISPEDNRVLLSLRAMRTSMQEAFKKKVVKRFALFSAGEIGDGLRRVEPFLRTIVDLVEDFRQAYDEAKRRRQALDFGDLERLAYRLAEHDEISSELRDKFEHVLVDEYQDINPVQDAILRRVCRDDCPDRSANLFTVGDIKQSIYRFRAADPEVFAQRICHCGAGGARADAIPLSENFRSQPRILEAANELFSRLMVRDFVGFDYDETHRLKAGRPFDLANPPGVTVHVLDRDMAAAEEVDEDASEFADPDSPDEWQTIEREAYVIGTEIKRLLDERTVFEGKELGLGDVAVLLRSPSFRADRMAEILGKMGIAAHTQARETLFDTTEIRDLRALLAVLDNTQQDIPLAALLRSNMLGQPFDENELLVIRAMNEKDRFCACVLQYAASGSDQSLRRKLSDVLSTLHRFRVEMRERPFADALWDMLERTGYLAFVGGLRGGKRRRGNLMRFHERARQFGTFKQQGLRRFIAYLDDLESQEQEMGAASSAPPSGDAVSIMSIHASKGLEFPIVFVADLGRRFNFRDKYSRMIHERSVGVCLRVVDPERMIEYPSAPFQLAAAEIDLQTRAEELRLLYVAMTRAQFKLSLVGTVKMEWVTRCRDEGSVSQNTPSPLAIQSASCALDWIVPSLVALPRDVCLWSASGGDPLFRVQTHEQEEMRTWQLGNTRTRSTSPALRAVASLASLPQDEPTTVNRDEADAVLDRIRFDYPHDVSTSVPSVASAGAVQRLYDVTVDLEFAHDAGDQGSRPSKTRSASPTEAARRGTATHLLLQHIDLHAAATIDSVRVEASRLVACDLITEEDIRLADIEAVAWYLGTDAAKRARDAGDAYMREFMFMAKHPAHWFHNAVAVDSDEHVLVRGVVDGVLATDDALEIVDFKTDRVEPADVAERAQTYINQMTLYAASIAPIFERPVDRCRLIFLHAREFVELNVPSQLS